MQGDAGLLQKQKSGQSSKDDTGEGSGQRVCVLARLRRGGGTKGDGFAHDRNQNSLDRSVLYDNDSASEHKSKLLILKYIINPTSYRSFPKV